MYPIKIKNGGFLALKLSLVYAETIQEKNPNSLHAGMGKGKGKEFPLHSKLQFFILIRPKSP